MADLLDGESTEVQGSGARSYTVKNTAGVYSCSCPAWMHQSLPIEKRSCKHLRALRGDEAEQARVGAALPAPRKPRGGEAQAPPVLLAERFDDEAGARREATRLAANKLKKGYEEPG